MDVPYLMHAPDGDELWLVDGEQSLLITPRIYDLLTRHGAELPPAYGIEELREQNAKLRELCKDWRRFAYDLFDEFVGEPEANDDFMALDDRTRELGVDV